MLAKISKCLCRNLFIGAATQIRAVYKDHKILVILKRCITFFVVLSKTLFCLFGESANKTKAFNLKVNCKELRLVFVHHVKTECI